MRKCITGSLFSYQELISSSIPHSNHIASAIDINLTLPLLWVALLLSRITLPLCIYYSLFFNINFLLVHKLGTRNLNIKSPKLSSAKILLQDRVSRKKFSITSLSIILRIKLPTSLFKWFRWSTCMHVFVTRKGTKKWKVS